MPDIILNNGNTTYSGNIASFNLPSSIYADDITIGIEPVQAGSGDPSPTNVRPISGWTGCNIKRTNSNLADNDYFANFSNYHASTGGYAYVEYFLRAGTYTINFAKRMSEGYARIGQMFFMTNGYTYPLTFTLEKDQNLEIFLNAWSEASLSRYFVDGNGIIITAGSTIGTFEPTATSTNRIPFPAEAGTVYGGTLDVTAGLLTVTHGNIASYNGESLPGKWISSMDVYSASGTPTTGAQIVYELATPQTYQFTPVEVKLLLGDNNVWADTGEISVKLGFSNNMNGKLVINENDLVYTFKTERTYVDKDVDLKIHLDVATVNETLAYLGISV